MKRGVGAGLGAGLSLVVGVTGVSAQVPDSVPRDTTVFRMEELRIRATRPIATLSGASAVRLNLESPRVGAAPLLSEALRKLPFVHVRENSRGEAQLTLRGTASRQVAVLVDGIPLTLGWDARTDLSVIPVDAAREIELYRGISSVLHGPNVLGGVVSIEIGRGEVDPDARSGTVQAGVDETGAFLFGGRLGRSWAVGEGGVSVQAGGSHRSRDGVPLPAGVSQPSSARPDRRLNSDLEHSSAFFTGRYQTGAGAWVSLSSFAYRAEKGVPPELHIAEPRRWRIPDTRRFVGAFSAGTAWGETPFGVGDFEVSLGLDVGDSEIDEYETLAYQNVIGREFADDRTLTVRALSDHEIGRGMFRTALTWADTRHIQRLDPGETSTFRQRLFSLGGEVDVPLGAEGSGFWSGVSLSAGVSFDRASTPETGGREPRDGINDWGARVGGSAQLGDATRFHFGASRRVRFPSLRELYSGALGRFVPNPDLEPEVLRAVEAGLTGTFDALGGDLEAQAVLFYQRFSDAIVRTGLGDGRFQRQNRNRVDAGGIELLAAARWSRVELGGDLTWQSVGLTDNLAPELQSRPEYQPEIAGSIHLTGLLPAGFRARAGVEAIGRQFCVDPDLGRDVALDRTARLDVLASREFRVGGPFRTLQATVSFDNITDAAVFDQCGLPQPGRLFRLQFRLF